MNSGSLINLLLESRLRTGRAARSLWAMWLVLTGMALIAAAPVVASLLAYFGHSRLTSRLALELDPAAITEWLGHGRDATLIQALATLAVLLLLATPVSAFLAGGAIGQLACRTGFWEGGSRYFWRFFRLAVFAGIFYMTALSLVAVAGERLDLWFQDSMEERPLAIGRRLLQALALAASWIIAAGFDYAKARMVLDDTRSATAAGFAGIGFVFRHPWRTLAPLAVIAAASLAIFAFYQTAYNVFDYRGMRTILISIAGQQIYILLRLWLRLWQWSACLHVDIATRRPSSPWAITEPEPHGDNI